MAKTGAIFSEDDAGRIARGVRKVERQPIGEGPKRRRRVPGQATALWAKLTSDFLSGAANTVKANPCEADGRNAISGIELVLYVEMPAGRTPDRSSFAADEIVAYVPHFFRDAEGKKVADGFLVGIMGPDTHGDGRVKVAKIVENLGAGLYLIAPQIWDPDLYPPAWINEGVTVTGNGGPVSPNGDYPRGGTYDGKPYYEIAGAAFSIWRDIAYWIISPTVGDPRPPHWECEDDDIEGSYIPFGYTGNPVVAATTLSARDISANANGVAGEFVFYWQQKDDNEDTETVCLVFGDRTWIAVDGSHVGPDDGTVYSPDTPCVNIYAYDLRGHCIGWWLEGIENTWVSPWNIPDPGYPA